MGRTRRRTSRPWKVVGALAVALVFLVPPTAAQADPDEQESDLALDLVQQAISLIANDGGAERVLEKMEDALTAPDPAGVDLTRVEDAVILVETEGSGADEDRVLAEARRLLAEAAPTLSEPMPMRPATGMETGTTVVLDEFRPARGISDGGDTALVVASVVAIVLGLWLARQLRPHHSIDELRHLGEPLPAGTTAKDGR